MLISIWQVCIVFTAVFITSYLLSLVVDFESDGRAVGLNKAVAALLFPFYRSVRFNVASVVLQISNYTFVIMYVFGFLFHNTVDIFMQALFTAAYIVITIVIMLVAERIMVSKNKKKGLQ